MTNPRAKIPCSATPAYSSITVMPFGDDAVQLVTKDGDSYASVVLTFGHLRELFEAARVASRGRAPMSTQLRHPEPTLGGTLNGTINADGDMI